MYFIYFLPISTFNFIAYRSKQGTSDMCSTCGKVTTEALNSIWPPHDSFVISAIRKGPEHCSREQPRVNLKHIFNHFSDSKRHLLQRFYSATHLWRALNAPHPSLINAALEDRLPLSSLWAGGWCLRWRCFILNCKNKKVLLLRVKRAIDGWAGEDKLAPAEAQQLLCLKRAPNLWFRRRQRKMSRW